MKKTIHILLAVLLIAGLSATAQIQRGNKKPSKPKTEKPAKTQSGNSTSSKKKKTQKTDSSPKLSKPSTQQQLSTQASSPKPTVPFVVQRVMDDMVFVEGGSFTMGATAEQGRDADDYEKPAHQVTLSSYYIHKYEVTQALWLAVMGSNPSHFTGDLSRPVEMVTWNDCQEFIDKLNKMTGKHFRLPTEAEWEYAARGGNRSKNYKYSGSDNLGSVAWYIDNSGSTTHPVGQKSPNELGLYDMSGNVWEWCQDWKYKYSNRSETNPTVAPTGNSRTGRGGCWNDNVKDCRVSSRSSNTLTYTYSHGGLRLAL